MNNETDPRVSLHSNNGWDPRIFSFFPIFELRKLEKISKNDFKKLVDKKIYN
jgi:hypothetical protein